LQQNGGFAGVHRGEVEIQFGHWAIVGRCAMPVNRLRQG
jgi:hypothetical protein